MEPEGRLLCHRINDGPWLLASAMDTAMSEFLSYRTELRTHFHSVSIKCLLVLVNTDLDSCELTRGKRLGTFLAPRALQLAVVLRALLGLSPLSLCSCYGHIPPGFKNKQHNINFQNIVSTTFKFTGTDQSFHSPPVSVKTECGVEFGGCPPHLLGSLWWLH